MAEDKKDMQVTLLNVRLSFADMFEPKVQKNEDGTERKTYGANFLIEKADDNGNKAKVQAAANAAKRKKWGDDKAKWPKLKPEKVCLRDGDLENWEGYADMLYVSANRREADGPPRVITNRKDADKKWITARAGEDNCPYAGCYVNAIVRVWAQDNEHGKRVNASVEAIQFLRDGDSFSGAAPINVDEEFSDDMVGEEGSLGDEDNGGYGDDDDDGDDSLV
jgi:hypothetical protein